MSGKLFCEPSHFGHVIGSYLPFFIVLWSLGLERDPNHEIGKTRAWVIGESRRASQTVTNYVQKWDRHQRIMEVLPSNLTEQPPIKEVLQVLEYVNNNNSDNTNDVTGIDNEIGVRPSQS
jgi:hypothetical protein